MPVIVVVVVNSCVYVHHRLRPICAKIFRSIGDEIAEGLGVIAEPEVIRKRISPNDKVCCIAS